MKRFTINIAILFALILVPSLAKAESSVELNLKTDIYSRYIFRGVDYGASPSIQPTLALTAGSFEIGYWGAIATNSSYQEIDLYAKYSIGGFSIMLTDYYIPTLDDSPTSADIRYFNFDDKTTAHTLEASVAYEFGESFPLKIMAGAFFYGNDKRWGYDADKDADEETYFSTYVELAYGFKIKENDVNVFLGLTPQAGAFGDTFGVVNLGLSTSKTLKIADFELPVTGAIIYNPQASAVHYIIGISL